MSTTAKTKLIVFMRFKQQLLDEASEKIKKPLEVSYFTEKDERVIKRWKKEESQETWKSMVHYLKSIPSFVQPFAAGLCPFCHHRYECRKCGYGRNHGICVEDESNDYVKIIIFLENNKTILNTKKAKPTVEKLRNYIEKMFPEDFVNEN